MKRDIEIKDEKLKKLVKEKGNIIEKGRKMHGELEKIMEKAEEALEKHQEFMEKHNEQAKDLNEVASDSIDKRKEIMRSLKDHLSELELGEYEMVENADIKEGKLYLTIVDRFAEFQENFKKDKEKTQEALETS